MFKGIPATTSVVYYSEQSFKQKNKMPIYLKLTYSRRLRAVDECRQ